MSEPPLKYYPTRRPSIHYTRQQPGEYSERQLVEIHMTRLQMEWFGAPPICFLPECRRAGQCRGNPHKGRFHLPPCFGHYREEYRFLMFAPGGLEDVMKEAGSRPTPARRTAPMRNRSPSTWPKASRCSSCSTARIRNTSACARSPHVRGPGGWKVDPEDFARYIEAGDWRNPERVCYRPPIRYGNVLVD